MSPKSNKGFTLVEVMVGIAILFIALMSALTVFTKVNQGQQANEESLGYASARNKLVSLLLDDTSWAKMISTPGSANNPDFSCLERQDSAAIGDRDCFGRSAPLVLYNIKGQTYTVDGISAYDFRSATQGISSKGRVCNTFVAPPAPGDPNCPYQVALTWRPICASSPCVNPPILFTGITSFNGDDHQLNPNLANLNFQVIKSRLYCPPISPATTPTGHLPAADLDVGMPMMVKSTLVTNTLTTAATTTDVRMAPCRRVIVSFSEDMPSAFTPEANNVSVVSIQNEATGAKVFQFRRIATGTSFDYQLLYNGTVVFPSKPSWLTINAATVFKFDVTDGLVKFCVDDRCLHYFPQKLDFPFRMSFQPASTLFTPAGFKDITYTLLDL